MTGNRPTTKPIPEDERPKSWKERVAALRYLPTLLRLVWETHRVFTLSMMLLRLARGFVPVAALWAAKLIIDQVVHLAQTPGASLTPLWRVVALELGIVVVGEFLARGSSLVESLLGDLFSNRMSVRLMRHAATLDLQQFEDPEFYDRLERARRQTTARIGLIAMLLSMGQNVLTLATLAAALIVHNPWLLLLLTVAIVPSFLGETHFAALSYSLLFKRTPERRELDYLRFVGASDRTAKEVQMFGLAGWLTDRYDVLAQKYYAENRKLSIRKAVVSAVLSLIGTLGYYGAYITILMRAVAGAISLGTLTFLASAFSRSRDLIQGLLLSASDIYEQSLYLKDLFVFFEMEPSIRSKPGAKSVPNPIQTGFVFEDVGFQYPGGARWAIRHVNLAITPGERIALVGENGAGKTTITKLLARLYDPTEGRILLDGVDIRDYDLASLRAAIGVIFQDFVRYDMRFDENVGVGEIQSVTAYLEQVRDVPPREAEKPPEALVDAADRSLASSLLPRFGDGYRQMLGRRFDDGVDLSGGEWQKIALARAYMRSAQLLILDEPTAALDARAEYEVFVRFNQLMAGRMAVVISHRFSTVRMADRIIVLAHGKVVEEGTHASLVASGGVYAELFEMQAKGYR
ncbi:MAG: ABC transporter ATP-binding protein [Gemmatimonadota bacterium]